MAARDEALGARRAAGETNREEFHPVSEIVETTLDSWKSRADSVAIIVAGCCAELSAFV